MLILKSDLRLLYASCTHRRLHWPEGYPTYKKKGRVRPAVPPSVWPNIPQSIVPERPPKPRETKRTSNHERNVYPDQIDDFERLDKFDFLQLKEQVTCVTPRTFAGPTTAFVNQEYVYIQSLAYSNGIPHFLLILSNELKFELFHHGVKIHAPFLSKNRVTIIDRWSNLDETVRFLNGKEIDAKTNVIEQHVSAMGCAPVGQKIYSPDIVVRAFEYFSTSRALYNRLREDYKFPSVSIEN